MPCLARRSISWTLGLAAAWVSGTARAEDVTYSRDVARILFARCTECHRPGQAAPFPLLTYEDARKRGSMVSVVVEDGTMPPWHPDPAAEPLRDARLLTDAERETISLWVEQGMPEGDPAETPKVPDFPDGWRLGEPDLVLTMAEPFDVPAGGPDINRCFVLPLDLPADKWVRAVEIRPSSRGVVHHALFFLGDAEAVRAEDARDEPPGFDRMGAGLRGFLGGWALGATPRFMPDGLALPLPAGTDFVLQIHFHPSGKAEREQATVGLYLSDEPPREEVEYLQLPPLFGALDLGTIRAGESKTMKRSRILDREVQLISVGGHAHYLGTTMKATATLPDGSSRLLFHIPRWDFKWQGRYDYEKPVVLPAGTRVDVAISYDNSDSNPNNPSVPPIDVRFGEGSTDEMGAVTFTFIDPAGAPAEERFGFGGRAPGRRGALGRVVASNPDLFIPLLMRADADGDGALSRSEAPGRIASAFDLLDADGDGLLRPEEIRSTLTKLKELSQRQEPASAGESTRASQ
jgi:hypothetical protein